LDAVFEVELCRRTPTPGQRLIKSRLISAST